MGREIIIMSLEKYYHKRIHVFLLDNIQYVGKVVDYTDAEDNTSDDDNHGEEYITIVPEDGKFKDEFVALFPQDIIEIKVL